MGHIDWDYFLLRSLGIVTDVPRYTRNIDTRMWMNPHGPIVTTIPESNITSNCNIFASVSRTSYLAYRGFTWHGAAKRESEYLRGNKTFENGESKNNFVDEKLGAKNL